MYLTHFASPGYLETWHAMEEQYLNGKIKVTGVADFEIKYLQRSILNSKNATMINETETHPELAQREFLVF